MPTQQTQNDGLIPSVVNWFAHPFNSQGDAVTWVLFVGLLVIAAWAWNHVLLHVEGKL